jgi:hypothetical protein
VASQIGRVLNEGSLSLFIGTGLSKVVSLPMWKELNRNIVQNAADVLKEQFGVLWTPELQRRLPTVEQMDDARDPLKTLDLVEEVCSCCETLKRYGSANSDNFVGNAPSWHLLVRRALYGDRKRYEFDEMFHSELVSLCSLLTGGRRGLIREIVTFNYDDLLESYLRLHGHPYHVVTPLPNQLTPNYCTVLYHPHGYLPLEDAKPRTSSFLVLSKRSYNHMFSGTGEYASLWRNLIKWMLTVRIGLFVGTSGNDDIFNLYFDEALKLCNPSQDGRPLAFALLVGDGYLAPSEWLKRRVVPLEFSDATAVAKFLSVVCQQAAELAGSS